MGTVHFFQKVFSGIGYPVLWTIKRLYKLGYTLWYGRRIIYKSSKKNHLKSFLKSIYPAVHLAKSAPAKIAMPKIPMPVLTIPKFLWPKLQIPKLQLPKVALPAFTFPKVSFPEMQFRFHAFRRPVIRFNLWRFLQVAVPIVLMCIGLTAAGLYFYVFKDLPSPESLSTLPLAQTTYIRDRNGTELYKIYRDENRTLVPLGDLPVHLQQATISIEDKEFYAHAGFSVTGISRAIWTNLTEQEQQGGSTITQQLVKTALLSPEKTLRRKLREVVLAMAVELKYTKEEILEMYLNRVSYGGATYGVQEAAQTYFGKSAQNLTLSESALLAGLPASPTTLSPYGSRPDLAKNRQREVLRRMVDDQYITWEEAEKASAKELTIQPPRVDIKAPHFVMYIKEYLAEKYGADVVEQGGLDVVTTLDLPTHEMTQEIVTQEVARVASLRIGNGAALVTNPKTGEILAMVGSQDYFNSARDGNVNVTTSLRQPGSSIKPINYALALTRGFTPATLIDDSPITYNIPGQPAYSPVNYDGRFHGKVTIRTALASSYNVPAVKILEANGVRAMIDLGQKMGISTWTDTDRFGLSLTLGGGEVTMLDMATAYGVLANYGQRVDLQPILSVRDSSGRILEEFRCDTPRAGHTSPLGRVNAAEAAATEVVTCGSENVLDARVAYLISDILSDNAARTPAFGAQSDLYIPNQQVAVKTGTTNNLRDNWTIGYTPNQLVVTWVGNNDSSSMSYVASGITGASPIWRKIMDELLRQNPSAGFTPPSNLVRVNVCTITGELACNGCPTRAEYFVVGTEPKHSCSEDAIKRIVEDRRRNNRNENDRDRDRLLDGASVGI